MKCSSDAIHVVWPIAELLHALDEPPKTGQDGLRPSLWRWAQTSAERERIEALLNRAAEPVAILNAVGELEYINPAFEAATGWTPDDAAGGNLRMHGLCRGEQFHEMWQTVSRGKVWRGGLSVDKKHGEVCEMEAVGAPLENAAGSVEHCLVVSCAAPEMLEYDEELLVAHKSQVAHALYAGFAHRLNNIMATLAGYANLISTSLEARPAESRAHLEKVETACRHVFELMQTMKTMSQAPPEPSQTLSLGRFARETANMLRDLLPHRIQLEIDTTDAPDSIAANPGDLRQLLLTLCIQAWQAMRPAGGVIRVSVDPSDTACEPPEQGSANATGECVQLRVHDTGPTPAQIQGQAPCAPFSASRRQGDATGLGLFAAERLAKRLGGTMTIEDQNSEGFSVQVQFPRVPPLERRGAAPDTDQLLARSRRILLADSDDTTRSETARLLLEQGCHVTTRTDGPAALEALRAHPDRFDLLLTRFAMPGMTGLELGREALVVRPGMQMVMFAADEDAATRERARKTGFRRVLCGPADKRRIVSAVREELDATKTGEITADGRDSHPG